MKTNFIYNFFLGWNNREQQFVDGAFMPLYQYELNSQFRPLYKQHKQFTFTNCREAIVAADLVGTIPPESLGTPDENGKVDSSNNFFFFYRLSFHI